MSIEFLTFLTLNFTSYFIGFIWDLKYFSHVFPFNSIQNLETLDETISNESAVKRIDRIPDNILVEESGKLVFLVELLDNLKQEGHRCLVFSHYRKILDIIEKVMRGRVRYLCSFMSSRASLEQELRSPHLEGSPYVVVLFHVCLSVE